MNHLFPPRIRTAGFLAAVLAILLALPGSTASAHEENAEAIEAYLHGLAEDGAITEFQHHHIEELFFKGHLSQLESWLDAQETARQMSHDTRLYVDALLNLGEPDFTPAAAPAGYSGNGNVTKLGQLDSQPPSPYYGDNSSTGTLYNGVWGYAAGTREYALQCNSFGLHILDVTDPAAGFRVQYIDMSGGVSPPKGRIWRDIDIHRDPASGKTYAYVGAQGNGSFWVVDLSYLSDSAPHGVDSNPIPPAGIADRGRANYGHTVFVNEDLGLLFLNTANNASTLGCQIFDLLQDPFNPPLLPSWTGSGHDCHDSFSRSNVPGSGGKDLLYSADGYATRYRILDVTNVRSGGAPALVGESAAVSGIYAHSNWLDDDSHYLYAFEEFNVRDIGVYDVSNPASPTQVTAFQWSGDATGNSRIHNGQVRGKYLITAYYEAGLRVFDISNPANPVEVGKYETWRDPDGDGTFNKTITGNFNGAWNLHVFLPSGNVLLSDMKSGTFIFRVDPVPTPGAVSGLAATAGNGQAGLTWAAASGATGYGVHRSTASGGPYTTVKSNIVGTSYTDTGLTHGTTYFYVVTATNAEGEGVSSNQASATPSVPVTPTTVTLTSVAAQDGWVKESTEASNVGGSLTGTATTTSALRVGDDNGDRQYKSVVSFDTSSIPDGATILSVTLRLRRGTLSGTSPFTTHGTCWVDVQNGGFSGSTALATGDFQAVATAVQATSLTNATTNGAWSEGSLNAAGLAAVDKTGTTQLRVYFNLDDNDDTGNDYIGYYSGDNATAANRPQLVVTYQ
ncbi:MAG TPA: choice-of-anchor B family protein [Thermoanaerobaculia bacterium]|nr:choice-of-anchor B family protein [Thermoanaerobaculia bacterium]